MRPKVVKISICAVFLLAIVLILSRFPQQGLWLILGVTLSTAFVFLFYRRITYGIYILLILSIFGQLFYNFGIYIGSVRIAVCEPLIITLYLAFLLKLYNERRLSLLFGRKLLILFFAIFTIPIIIGLQNNFRIEGIFRDARFLFYNFAIFIMIYTLRSKREIIRYLDWMVILSLIALGYHALALVLNMPFESGMSVVPLTEGGYIRTYGLWTAWTFYQYSFFYLLALHIGEKQDSLFKNGRIRIILMIIFVYFSLIPLVRVIFIYLIFGAAFIYFFLRGKGSFKFNLAYASAVIIAFYLLGTTVFGFRGFQQINYFVERYGSIIMPSVSTQAAHANYLYRLNAFNIAVGYTGGFKLFGLGYGESSLTAIKPIAGYLGHNSYAGIFAKAGAIGLVIIVGLYLYILLKLFNLRRNPNLNVLSMSLFAILLSNMLAGISAGAMFQTFISFGPVALGIAFAVINLSRQAEIM